MVKDIKYIIKRIIVGVGIALILMLFKGGLIANVYAADTTYTIYLENTTNSFKINANINSFTYVSGQFNRISVVNHNYNIQNEGKYELYSTITLGIDRGSSCTSSNMGLRSDFYIGNSNRTSWINPTTTWNHVDDINPGSNNYCNYTWGSVQTFNSNISSNGITYDFYFTNPTNINYIKIDRFDLINTGTTTGDAINNMTNQIINNQNTNNNLLIENQNNNTDDIINNQNQNTQDIIDNQNQNSQQEIESQKVCKTKILKYSDTLTKGYNLSSNGSFVSNSFWGVTDYIPLDSLDIITTPTYAGQATCFYKEDKSLISCFNYSNYSTGIYQLPNDTFYARFSIRENDVPQFKINTCINGNQALNDSINDLDNTINDSSVDNPSSDIDSMKGKLASNGSITQLITLPITLYQSVLNNINGSCSTFNLGSLYNHNLSLPCIQPENYLGSSLWGVIDVLCCGLFILSFRKRMVDIFNHMSSLKDGGNELE